MKTWTYLKSSILTKMKIGKNHIYLGKRPDKLAKEGAEKEIPEPIDI